jgi:hypothetical protein
MGHLNRTRAFSSSNSSQGATHEKIWESIKLLWLLTSKPKIWTGFSLQG